MPLLSVRAPWWEGIGHCGCSGCFFSWVLLLLLCWCTVWGGFWHSLTRTLCVVACLCCHVLSVCVCVSLCVCVCLLCGAGDSWCMKVSAEWMQMFVQALQKILQQCQEAVGLSGFPLDTNDKVAGIVQALGLSFSLSVPVSCVVAGKGCVLLLCVVFLRVLFLHGVVVVVVVVSVLLNLFPFLARCWMRIVVWSNAGIVHLCVDIRLYV